MIAFTPCALLRDNFFELQIQSPAAQRRTFLHYAIIINRYGKGTFTKGVVKNFGKSVASKTKEQPIC